MAACRVFAFSLIVNVALLLSGCSEKSEGAGTTSSVVPASTLADGESAKLTELAVASGNGDPGGVVLPAAQDGVVAWLNGDGSVAVRAVEVTKPLWAEGSSSCDEVAIELDALGSPSELLAAASETPDPVTSELLISFISAIGQALRECGNADGYQVAVQDLAWTWALADRRLTELGIAR